MGVADWRQATAERDGQWPKEWGPRGEGLGRCLFLAPAADLPSRALLGEGRSLHPQASCWGTDS